MERLQEQDQTEPTECEIISMEKCLHFSLIPAVFIVGVLSFLQRRVQKHAVDHRLPFLQGRFGIVVPMDVMSFSNRWSYGFAFGAISYSVLELFFEQYMPKVPIWATAIAYLIGGFEVGLAYFPFFACLSTPFRKTGAVMGILYSVFWIVVVGRDWHFCPRSQVVSNNDFIKELLQGCSSLGSFCENWAQYQKLIYQWPRMLSLIFLLVRFIFLLVKGVRKQSTDDQGDSEELMLSNQLEHVKRLLRATATYSKPLNWFQRHVYEWDPCFKFPNRVIGTAIVSFLALYVLALTDIGASTLIFSFLELMIINSKETYLPGEEPLFSELLDVSRNCWRVALALASLNSVVYICHVLVCYRKHIKRLWQGQKDFLPKKLQNPSSAVSVASIAKYCGCQIAFTVWGYVIVRFVQFLAAMAFSYLLVIPIKNGEGEELIQYIITVVVTFGSAFGLFKLQVVMVQFFFLQDKLSPTDNQKPLALNNRKAFNCFNYFFFFYNVVMGVASCLIRILISFVLGTWLVSRIDRTIMQRGYETLDWSYRTWIGMIYADHYHNNPVMVCFCHLLVSHIQQMQHGSSYSILNNAPCDSVNNRVRKRWRLFYTLLKNPHLIPLRKHHLSASVPLKLASSSQADIVVRAWLMRSQTAPQPLDRVAVQC